jgi:hypothetical protein
MPPNEDQTTDQKKTEDEFNPFFWMADIRDNRGASEKRVDEALYANSLDEIATKHWMTAAEEDDPIGFAKFSALLDAERKQTKVEEQTRARREAFEAEQAKLEELEQAARMGAIQEEAAAALREAEVDAFLADGGLPKARALADVVASKETPHAEAMAAWDAASEVEREVASAQFGVGVIDFDVEEVLGTGGAS